MISAEKIKIISLNWLKSVFRHGSFLDKEKIRDINIEFYFSNYGKNKILY